MNKHKDLDAWDKSWVEETAHGSRQDGWFIIDQIKLNRLLNFIPAAGRVLEVGCGSARLSSFLANRGFNVFGLDYAWNGLMLARRRAERPISLVQGDAFKLPFADGTFDVVLSTGLLEHFPDPSQIVSEMARVLKPGGYFYSDVVPHKFSLFRITSYRQTLKVGGEEVFEGAFGPKDIRDWMNSAGNLEDIKMLGAGVLPPYGFTSRQPFQKIVIALKPLWKALEGGVLGRIFGCYYFVSARRKK